MEFGFNAKSLADLQKLYLVIADVSKVAKIDKSRVNFLSVAAVDLY